MVSSARNRGRQRRLIVLAGIAASLVLFGALWAFAVNARKPARPSSSSAAPAPIAPALEPSEVAPDREPVAVPVAPPPSDEIPADAPERASAPSAGLALGHVSDERGLAIAHVTIEAWRAQDFGAMSHRDARGPKPAATSATDGAGGFSFRLAPDTYVFTYGDAHFPLPDVEPQQVGAVAVDLAVTLPDLGSLELTVHDEKGSAAPDVIVSGSGREAGQLALRTDASGVARARHLPPGAYSLFADAPELGRGSLGFELQPHTQARIEIVLRPRPTR
jgi:hypothetical protein